MKTKQIKGFTLLEVLLVIALIAILAGIVIVAINPVKQLAEGRNTQRRADVNTILNAVYQYTIDNNGVLPASVPSIASCSTAVLATATNEICRTATCAGYVDLSVLTASGKYIVAIPFDPKSSSTNGADYYICKDSTSSRITVASKDPENSATITVTR
jgi:type IV pilus assembly protein PilA